MAKKTRLGSGGYGIRRTGSFAGKAVDLGIVEDLFLAALLAGLDPGIKKPGIPADAPAWLRVMLEIMLGRRGNAVTVPVRQSLTFSAVPTQAECEALYAYANTLQDTLDQLITRFDS